MNFINCKFKDTLIVTHESEEQNPSGLKKNVL